MKTGKKYKIISAEAILTRRVPARQPVYFVRHNKVDKMLFCAPRAAQPYPLREAV